MGALLHSWPALSELARERVLHHEADPADRRRLREAYYADHASSRLGRYGYGTAEIAFLQWEIDRGVLNPLDHPTRPGSPWWRGVNHHFNHTSETAGLAHQRGLSREDAPEPVALWLDYLAAPSRRTWYSAHTRSILDGVVAHADVLLDEPASERAFINRVLRRLSLAHHLALMPAPLGLVADPRLGAVDFLTATPLYPRTYPHPGRWLIGSAR